MSAVVPDKTGEVDNDQNDNGDQNDATAADMVRIHLTGNLITVLRLLKNTKFQLPSIALLTS